jgi:two-component system phosphate regulon response regulator PhoB
MNSARPPVPDRDRQRTVVCIEDESETVTLIKLILERAGFRVISALNGRDGLDLARRVEPDVVLLDLMMPGMDGWEVHRRMKADETLSHVPVIVLTGVHRTSEGVRDLQVADYVTKPFSPRDLIRRVRAAAGVPPQEAMDAEGRSQAGN